MQVCTSSLEFFDLCLVFCDLIAKIMIDRRSSTQDLTWNSERGLS